LKVWQGSDIWEQCVISGFCHEVDDNCAPLGYYAASKGKGKAIPLQAWTGPEGSRSLRLPDFKTFGT